MFNSIEDLVEYHLERMQISKLDHISGECFLHFDLIDDFERDYYKYKEKNRQKNKINV